jgi:membrane-bound lytic murein transglycosylase B
VAAFRQRAGAKGVSDQALDAAFGDAHFLPHVISLDNRQPEFSRAIWDYLDTAVSASRVRHGRDKLSQYDALARRVQTHYGVSRYVITAIWGMESNYGSNFGRYETIDALATLGYDGRRETFAERQLYAAMKILADGDISRDDMRGSWAGAMGHTQFLPTSFLAYAVDGDGDGKRDIWGSIPDVVASTANYLSKNGWDSGHPWGREVILPAGFDYTQADGSPRRSTAAWRAIGVKPIDSRGMPEFSAAGILAPAGARGPAFIVGPNFRTILRYNNATSYALAVGLLSDRLAGNPGVQKPWPRQLANLSNSQIRQLQAGLKALGYGSGTPDGIVGPNTRAGIRAFQRAQGQVADGYPTEALLQKINASL